MRTLPAILLVLAAARAEAWPENVYVAQSDGSISVLDGGGLTTNHTPRPFPTNLCRATDGAADPGGGVVWFVTRCGEAFTIDDHGLVTLKMPAPMPLSIFRTMRIAVDDMGTAYIASGQKKIDWISRDDTRSAIGTTGTVFEVVAGRGGLIHFHDATAQKLKTLDPVRGGSITDVGPLTGRPWLVYHPFSDSVIAVDGNGRDVVIQRFDLPTRTVVAGPTLANAGANDPERYQPAVAGDELYVPTPNGLAVIRGAGTFPFLYGWVGLPGAQWAAATAGNNVWVARSNGTTTLVDTPQYFTNPAAPALTAEPRVIVSQGPRLVCYDATDSDGDGPGDACDLCPYDADNDEDRDGVCGDVDNCPSYPNAMQEDVDGDTIGDVCDDDNDHDQVPDTMDNCPTVPNNTQADRDGDGVGDACDNCPAQANPDQRNSDHTGGGNACDPDDDDDTIADGVDNCPTVANRDQADGNGNGIGDACEHNLTLSMYGIWDARLDALAAIFGDRFAPRQMGPWGPWDPLSPCPKCTGETLTAYQQALGIAGDFLRENDALFPAERVIQFLDMWKDTDRAQAISHLNRRFGEGW